MNSLIVTEIIARSIENGCKEMIRKSINLCAEKYGFDASDAIEYLNLSNIKLERKVMRRSKGKKEKGRKIPMPFNKEMVSDILCQGIRYNGGLYTQCENECKSKGYCDSCKKEGENNGSGKPDNGSIEERMKVGIMEYKDSKGRSPKEYLKVLKKLNISEEEARKEAGNKNYIIDEMHFEKEKKEKKEKEVKGEKGRPKKDKKEVEAQVSPQVKEVKEVVKKDKKEKKEKEVKEVKVDLFAELAIESENNEVVVNEEKKKTPKKSKKVEFTETENVNEEKEKKKSKAKVALVEDEEKAKKEAEKEAEEKAKKEAEEKAKKEAEEKAEKEKEEAEKKDADKKKVSVTRFEFEGKKYLKSSENILYDADTKEEMGIWCEDLKSIKELPEEDDEEMEEEEYDE